MDAKNVGVREKIMCTIISLYRGIKDKKSKLGHPPTLLLWPSYTSCQKITPVNLSIFFLQSSYYMAESSRVGTMYMKFST